MLLLREDVRKLAMLRTEARHSLTQAMQRPFQRDLVTAAAHLAGVDHALNLYKTELDEALRGTSPTSPDTTPRGGHH